MINALILIILNTIYFICNIYPKHILEINSPLSIFAVIFNLLFYLLFSVFLIISINKNKNVFSKDIFLKFEKIGAKIELNRILLVCATQILFDIIVIFLNLILKKNILYIIDLVTVLIWVIIYNICATKERNIFRKSKGYIVIIVLMLLLIMTTYCNFNLLEKYSSIVNKYSVDSFKLQEAVNNLDFLFQTKNFLLDTIIGLLLLETHFILNKSCAKKAKEKHIKQAIRFSILIIIALFLIGVKSFIFPYSCIKSLNVKTSETDNNFTLESFSATTKTTVIKRLDYNSSEETVFQITNNKLFYKGNLILDYNSNDNIPAISYDKVGNQMIVNDCFEKYFDNGVEFYLYKNEIICFLYDNTPIAVYYENTSENYSEYLVTIYKNLIVNNNWNFFEQGAKYLLKHDMIFIEPYLERFSLGEFNETELKKLDELNINKIYIQYVSKELNDTK